MKPLHGNLGPDNVGWTYPPSHLSLPQESCVQGQTWATAPSHTIVEWLIPTDSYQQKTHGRGGGGGNLPSNVIFLPQLNPHPWQQYTMPCNWTASHGRVCQITHRDPHMSREREREQDCLSQDGWQRGQQFTAISMSSYRQKWSWISYSLHCTCMYAIFIQHIYKAANVKEFCAVWLWNVVHGEVHWWNPKLNSLHSKLVFIQHTVSKITLINICDSKAHISALVG